ncbi:MAG: hypothetical protein M1814_001375 [Vezdaea aestivalis]|nr:MAG: hypothetical protein M1814_001375 [Vezdaea aestivalis]
MARDIRMLEGTATPQIEVSDRPQPKRPGSSRSTNRTTAFDLPLVLPSGSDLDLEIPTPSLEKKQDKTRQFHTKLQTLHSISTSCAKRAGLDPVLAGGGPGTQNGPGLTGTGSNRPS